MVDAEGHAVAEVVELLMHFLEIVVSPPQVFKDGSAYRLAALEDLQTHQRPVPHGFLRESGEGGIEVPPVDGRDDPSPLLLPVGRRGLLGHRAGVSRSD